MNRAASKLTPPAKGKIPVAFAISEGVTVIDFAGPWEVFQDVHVSRRGKDMDEQMPFELFTVSEKTEPLTGSAGLKLVPDYTFDIGAATQSHRRAARKEDRRRCMRGCAKCRHQRT